MSGFAEKVKGYYELCLWDDGRVKAAVEKGKLTAEEYLSITGKEYTAE